MAPVISYRKEDCTTVARSSAVALSPRENEI
jgi:hypothetical protein